MVVFLRRAMKVYMDVCCLNRPFDDQNQDRIHLEAEAVLAIVGHVRDGDWTLLGSEVVRFEIGRSSDSDRRERVSMLAAEAATTVTVGDAEYLRAAELVGLGFKSVDALHVACAEAGKADVCLTTDDRMLSIAARPGVKLTVRVVNPLAWLQEVTGK